jgi:uncharacterized protein (DUF1330 family)
MPAYCLFDLMAITDPAVMAEYRRQIRANVEAFGGRYLVSGGTCETVEGEWALTYPVLLEFPTLTDAHRWYRSPEYAPLLAQRLAATRSRAVFMESPTNEFVRDNR